MPKHPNGCLQTKKKQERKKNSDSILSDFLLVPSFFNFGEKKLNVELWVRVPPYDWKLKNESLFSLKWKKWNSCVKKIEWFRSNSGSGIECEELGEVLAAEDADARPDAEAVFVFLSRELLNRFKCILFFTLKLKMAFFKVSGNVRANISPRILSRWRLNREKFCPTLCPIIFVYFFSIWQNIEKSENEIDRGEKKRADEPTIRKHNLFYFNYWLLVASP